MIGYLVRRSIQWEALGITTMFLRNRVLGKKFNYLSKIYHRYHKEISDKTESLVKNQIVRIVRIFPFYLSWILTNRVLIPFEYLRTRTKAD